MRGQLWRLGVKELPAGKDVSMEAKDIVEIRYQATANEDIEYLACAIVSGRVSELARAL
jgi:hypothetical protein